MLDGLYFWFSWKSVFLKHPSAHPVFDHRLQITSILIIFGTVLLPTPFSIGNINKENLPCKDVIALVSSMRVLWISVVGANLHRHQTIRIIRSWLIVVTKRMETSMNPRRKRSLLWGASSTFPTSTLDTSVRPWCKSISNKMGWVTKICIKDHTLSTLPKDE